MPDPSPPFTPSVAPRGASRARHAVGVAVALALALGSSAARAGLFDDDEARRAILELRDQRKADAARIDALGTQNEQLRRSLLDINAQLDTLRQDLARQRGDSEVLARDLAEAQRKARDVAAIDARLARLEPLSITLDGKTFQAEADEKRDFEAALGKLRQADFAGGLNGLQALLKRVPTTGYRESALYWMGNAHYGLRDYKDCISQFRLLLNEAPQHQRAPEALLSVANCHNELKETRAARKALDDLVRNFPDSEAAQVARERLAAAPPPPANPPAKARR